MTRARLHGAKRNFGRSKVGVCYGQSGSLDVAKFQLAWSTPAPATVKSC